jgi:hypothetical protein
VREWKNHRDTGKEHDSFKCYQTLEADISFISQHGIAEFQRIQERRGLLLEGMLKEFNEGRSKTYYCIAATVLQPEELEEALSEARKESEGLDVRAKSKVLHRILDGIASRKHYHLKMRK